MVRVLKPPWIIINGIPNPFWRAFQKNIGAFIKENRLKPTALIESKAEKLVDEAMEEWIKILKGRYGGDRGPHFHYNGDVYHLTNEQWTNFSKPIMEEMAKKLTQAKTIPFEQTMELADTINAFQGV
jgi:hypothetical protein